MAVDVFLSIGTPATALQEEMIRAFEASLAGHGLSPRALGRTDWSEEQPLRHIRRVMAACHGTAVLALERVYIERGTTRRGHALERELRDVAVPSVWLQIEAGMAYEQGQPIFVVVAEGVREEGLLEDGHDWIVQRVPMDPGAFQGAPFREALARWSVEVRSHARARGEALGGG